VGSPSTLGDLRRVARWADQHIAVRCSLCRRSPFGAARAGRVEASELPALSPASPVACGRKSSSARPCTVCRRGVHTVPEPVTEFDNFGKLIG
jgi:hypothetical protein